jgi:hypothetical protein
MSPNLDVTGEHRHATERRENVRVDCTLCLASEVQRFCNKARINTRRFDKIAEKSLARLNCPICTSAIKHIPGKRCIAVKTLSTPQLTDNLLLFREIRFWIFYVGNDPTRYRVN